jgi:hypothetical protein
LSASTGGEFDQRQNGILHSPVYVHSVLIPVAARSKAWVYGRSLAGIAGSNSGGGMDFCLLECYVLSGRGLCDRPMTRPEES